MAENKLPNQPDQAPGPSLVKAVLRLMVLSLLMFAVLFLMAGTWRWWQAWAYVGQGLVVLIAGRAYILLYRPEMALERAEASQREGVQPWDRWLMPLTALYLPILSWVIAGLAFRLDWPPDLPVWTEIAALVVLFLGGMLGNWAMIANPFFSSQVRIQKERGHSVVAAGPYRFVRHPGYSGSLLSWLAAPFVFCSYGLMLLALLAAAAVIARTALEDRFLRENLPGYQEYARKVRWRLVPGVW